MWWTNFWQNVILQMLTFTIIIIVLVSWQCPAWRYIWYISTNSQPYINNILLCILVIKFLPLTILLMCIICFLVSNFVKSSVFFISKLIVLFYTIKVVLFCTIKVVKTVLHICILKVPLYVQQFSGKYCVLTKIRNWHYIRLKYRIMNFMEWIQNSS